MSVYLAYTGMDNMFLTEEPQFTHFKTVYTRDEQSMTKVIEHAFDQTNYRPGDTISATMKQNGDYISDISLKLVLPKLTPDAVTVWSWYTNPVYGETVYGFDTSGSLVFTVTLNSRQPTTSSSTWYSKSSSSITLSFQNNKTRFNYPTSIGYLIFSSFETARLFGFVNNSIQLFSGYLRFNVNTLNPTSQVTFAECGWLQGTTGLSSYTDDICYKLINSIGLYIGKQLIQEFDSTIINFRKDVDTTYKNRPVLKLLEGDTSVVDFNRVYYFDIPFVKIPVYAIPRHDVQIRLVTNPLIGLSSFYASLVISFNTFSDTSRLPRKYKIPFTQVQYFDSDQELQIRNPVKNVFVNGNPYLTLKLNGERFFGNEKTKIDSFENSKIINIPRTSNVAHFDGPLNMSRIRDQKFETESRTIELTTTSVESLNINDIVYVSSGGGVINNDLVTFTSSGSIIVSSTITCDILIVAGGGGGGGTNDRTAGGGGAGGVIYLTNQTLTPGTYNVTVGYGGFGGSSGNNGQNGGNSSFGTLGTAIGGGGGAGVNFVAANSGGSGGGICHGAGDAGSGTPGQGYNGGPSATNNAGGGIFTASGGGGAGGIGGNGTNSGAGAGGIGIQNSITGTATYYAGGGGGSANYIYGTVVLGGSGGLGGGGSGATTSGPNNAYVSVNGGDATFYGGGGGGSAANSATVPPCRGGNGYQGIVIVKITNTDIVTVTHYDEIYNSFSNLYAETINFLVIENDMAGLLFDYTDVKGGYRKLSSTNAIVPQPTPPPETLYIFDYIPNTAVDVVSIYSMRRTSIAYTGPVVRLINSVTFEEDDFYTDSAQTYLVNSSNVSVSEWSNGNAVKISRWYDQSGNGNFMYQSFIGSPELSYQNGKYVIFFNNPRLGLTFTQQWLLFSKPILSIQQCTSIMKPLRIGDRGSIIFGMNSYMLITDQYDYYQNNYVASRSIAVNPTGRFVAIEYYKNAVYSDDGITWSNSTLPSLPNGTKWNCIACDSNGHFVALSTYNISAYSTNGTSWSTNSIPVRNWVSLAVNSSGRFVAVSTTNYFMYSDDGITWTEVTLTSDFNKTWCSVTCDPRPGGKFVAVSNQSLNVYAYSSDGISWTLGTLPYYQKCVSVTVNNNGRFVIAFVEQTYYNYSGFLYSDDGTTWTNVRSLYPYDGYWYTVTANPVTNGFVAATNYGDIYGYSPNGASWTFGRLPSVQLWKYSIASPTTGKFLIITEKYTVYVYSNDGINWTQSVLKPAPVYMNISPFSTITNKGTVNDYANVGEWNTITAYGNTIGGTVNIVSDNAYGHNAENAFYGYMFELGFFGSNTLSSETAAYYAQRPVGF